MAKGPGKAKAPKINDKVALAERIRHHRAQYYAGTPEISDAEFDALEEELRTLDPAHPVLAEVGAPVFGARVGEADSPKDASRSRPGFGARVGEADSPKDASRSRPGLGARVGEAAVHSPQGEALLAMSRAFYQRSPELGTKAGQQAYKASVREYRARFEALADKLPPDAALLRAVPAEGHDWLKARHELPMGSLNKANTEEDLRDWCKRCDELAKSADLGSISGDLAITEKLDGLSLELLYEGGELTAAITRGDGQAGELITPNVEHMLGVPARIKEKGRLSVRGEIILTREHGTRFERERRKLDSQFEELKSLRNTAAGLARAKDPKYLPLVSCLTVICYDLEGLEFDTESAKLERLRKLGFETPTASFSDADGALIVHKRYQETTRAELGHEIDGLVIRANNTRTAALLGDLNNRPRAAVALKFSNEMQETTLVSVLWSTGDSGRITPIAQIEPVFLAGAEVRQASLHNVANMARLNIGPGDRVLVSRRNDVIPYVEQVVEKRGPVEKPPENCSRCRGAVSVEGEYLVCRNATCPARCVGRLRVWIREMNLLDWGERTLERFFEEGLVVEVADLYRLKIEDVTRLEGFGEISAKRLLEPLQEKKKLPITTFIAALGIEGVSRETAKLLARAGYDTIEAIVAADAAALSTIGGLGPVKAERILEGLRNRLPEIERLASVGVIPTAPKEGGPLAGLSFCFSGSHSRPRKLLEQLVDKNGGTVAAGVTKGLTYLVLADPNSASTKAEKAKKLGTQVIDEATFDALLQEKGDATH